MANKEPKTFGGQMRKQMSGDGRKNLNTAIRENIWGKQPKGKRRKKDD